MVNETKFKLNKMVNETKFKSNKIVNETYEIKY